MANKDEPTPITGFAEKTIRLMGVALNQDAQNEVARQKTAKGQTRDDYLYRKARKVESYRVDSVVVTYGGQMYGPGQVSWGPLDYDHDKSTTLINTGTEVLPRWTLFWFYKTDVTPLQDERIVSQLLRRRFALKSDASNPEITP